MITTELDIDISKSFFWTDSTIVLSYIMNEDKRFYSFVANRLAVFHENTLTSQWRHVESKSNPADDVSREMPADLRDGRKDQGPVSQKFVRTIFALRIR